MEIVYADPRIVVAVKPAGVLSTDEPGGMPQLLRQELGTPCIRTVHRLDAAVSGLMVYARVGQGGLSVVGAAPQPHLRQGVSGGGPRRAGGGRDDGPAGAGSHPAAYLCGGGAGEERAPGGACPMRCWGAGRGCHWCVSGCTPGEPIKFGCSLPPVGFHWWGTGNTAGERKGKASPCGRGGWSLPIHRPGRPCGFPNCRPGRPRGWAFPCP